MMIYLAIISLPQSTKYLAIATAIYTHYKRALLSLVGWGHICHNTDELNYMRYN